MLAADSISLFASETSIPILGIDWHDNSDCFSFHIAEVPIELPFTKRSVLSRIARLFDPMGWLAPIVIPAKIIMQSLCLIKVGWDDELPLDISNRWQTWLQDLHTISHIKIPRWNVYTPNCDLLEIRGLWCSNLPALNSNSKCSSHNVSGQTRVAPLKTLSIPRLELCAALLLARLSTEAPMRHLSAKVRACMKFSTRHAPNYSALSFISMTIRSTFLDHVFFVICNVIASIQVLTWMLLLK